MAAGRQRQRGMSVAQLSMLLEGIDWRRPERTWQPRAAA
jgi:transposase